MAAIIAAIAVSASNASDRIWTGVSFSLPFGLFFLLTFANLLSSFAVTILYHTIESMSRGFAKFVEKISNVYVCMNSRINVGNASLIHNRQVQRDGITAEAGGSCAPVVDAANDSFQNFVQGFRGG